ncbi:MAG: ATP-binding cassette domain-containing protein [Phycisphaerales bacterium JB059]
MPLIAQDLTFAYRRPRSVLRGVSLEVLPGQVTSVVGPNGSGKSTLARLLIGRLSPNAGRVLLDGRPVHRVPSRARARRIAFVPQRAALAFAYSVEQVVRFGLIAQGRPPRDALVRRAMERADIAHRAREPFAQLSAGQQQRVTLARAMAQLSGNAPAGERALIADEPTASMDPRHALTCMELLRDLAADGVGVVLVIHDLSLALRISDRVLLLDASGRPAAAGPASEVLTPAVLRPVFGVRFARVHPRGADEQAPDADLPPALLPITTMTHAPDERP